MIDRFKLAQGIAIKAGDVALGYFKKEHTFHHKGHLSNFATEADLASEKVVYDLVKKNFPGDNFLSEEMGLVENGGEYTWVVDPIDGTVVFSRGMPLWGIAMSVFQKDEPIIGVINFPVFKELYHCQKGKGVFLNKTRLRVNDVNKLEKSLVALEYCYADNRPKQKFPFEAFLRNFPGMVSNFLSTVLDLTAIASGKIEGLVEETPNIWDISAGTLMIEEAGGKVTNWEGQKIKWDVTGVKKYNIIASNGVLHEKLRTELEKYQRIKELRNMKLIVGLGNPGKEYEKTRHNVGFMVVDELTKTYKVGKDVILLKPQVFMNESGKAVKKELRKQGIKDLTNSLWVIHDDLDIELGRIKIHSGGSSGHHGIESIIKEVGTDEFIKFRVGIGRPKLGEDACYYQDTKEFLLSPFTKEELPTINSAVKKTAQAVKKALEEGIEKTMNEFNK